MDATLASIIAAAAPLVFAAVGETITERAGVVNLSLDGSILLSAMSGFAVASMTDSVVLGFAAAAATSGIFALIVAWSGIVLKMNQIAVGFVLTLLGASLSAFLGDPFVRQPGPQVAARPIPGAAYIVSNMSSISLRSASVTSSTGLAMVRRRGSGYSSISRMAMVTLPIRVLGHESSLKL